MNLSFHKISGLKSSNQQYSSCDIYKTFMTDGKHDKVHNHKKLGQSENGKKMKWFKWQSITYTLLSYLYY